MHRGQTSFHIFETQLVFANRNYSWEGASFKMKKMQACLRQHVVLKRFIQNTYKLALSLLCYCESNNKEHCDEKGRSNYPDNLGWWARNTLVADFQEKHAETVL